jgi:capsular exopolysaccharide synthesis family protein
MGLENRLGLANVLTGQADYLQAIRSIDIAGISPSPKTLDVMTSGPYSPDSIHAFSSPRMESTLSAISDQYDFLLLDSPPVLSVNDPLVLASNVDGVLFVIGTGEAGNEELRRAKDRLERSGGGIVGSVLNRFDESSHKPGYHPYQYADQRDRG